MSTTTGEGARLAPGRRNARECVFDTVGLEVDDAAGPDFVQPLG
jgi:hypothetical protein